MGFSESQTEHFFYFKDSSNEDNGCLRIDEGKMERINLVSKWFWKINEERQTNQKSLFESFGQLNIRIVFSEKAIFESIII